MKITASILGIFIFLFVINFAYAEGLDRGNFGFQLGGMSKPVNDFEVKTSGAVFGGGFNFGLSENSPLYWGANFLINKPSTGYFESGGSLYPVYVRSYLFDGNFGARLKIPKLPVYPYVELGIGLSRLSQSTQDGYYSYNLGSKSHFTRHTSFGVKILVTKNIFTGAKASFYSGAGKPLRMFLGEVGFSFTNP